MATYYNTTLNRNANTDMNVYRNYGTTNIGRRRPALLQTPVHQGAQQKEQSRNTEREFAQSSTRTSRAVNTPTRDISTEQHKHMILLPVEDYEALYKIMQAHEDCKTAAKTRPKRRTHKSEGRRQKQDNEETRRGKTNSPPPKHSRRQPLIDTPPLHAYIPGVGGGPTEKIAIRTPYAERGTLLDQPDTAENKDEKVLQLRLPHPEVMICPVTGCSMQYMSNSNTKLGVIKHLLQAHKIKVTVKYKCRSDDCKHVTIGGAHEAKSLNAPKHTNKHTYTKETREEFGQAYPNFPLSQETCPKCDSVFASKAGLAMHARVHTKVTTTPRLTERPKEQRDKPSITNAPTKDKPMIARTQARQDGRVTRSMSREPSVVRELVDENNQNETEGEEETETRQTNKPETDTEDDFYSADEDENNMNETILASNQDLPLQSPTHNQQPDQVGVSSAAVISQLLTLCKTPTSTDNEAKGEVPDSDKRGSPPPTANQTAITTTPHKPNTPIENDTTKPIYSKQGPDQGNARVVPAELTNIGLDLTMEQLTHTTMSNAQSHDTTAADTGPDSGKAWAVPAPTIDTNIDNNMQQAEPTVHDSGKAWAAQVPAIGPDTGKAVTVPPTNTINTTHSQSDQGKAEATERTPNKRPEAQSYAEAAATPSPECRNPDTGKTEPKTTQQGKEPKWSDLKLDTALRHILLTEKVKGVCLISTTVWQLYYHNEHADIDRIPSATCDNTPVYAYVMPVFRDRNHFALLAVDLRSRTIELFDSIYETLPTPYIYFASHVLSALMKKRFCIPSSLKCNERYTQPDSTSCGPATACFLTRWLRYQDAKFTHSFVTEVRKAEEDWIEENMGTMDEWTAESITKLSKLKPKRKQKQSRITDWTEDTEDRHEPNVRPAQVHSSVKAAETRKGDAKQTPTKQPATHTAKPKAKTGKVKGKSVHKQNPVSTKRASEHQASKGQWAASDSDQTSAAPVIDVEEWITKLTDASSADDWDRVESISEELLLTLNKEQKITEQQDQDDDCKTREQQTQTGSDLSRNSMKRKEDEKKKTTNKMKNTGKKRKFDPIESSRIQKLYKSNKSRAIAQVLGQTSSRCEIQIDEIEAFYRSEYGLREVDIEALETNCPPIEQVEQDHTSQLVKPISAQEVKKTLERMPRSAPGADNITYRDLQKLDPSGRALACLYNICMQKGKIPSTWKKAYTILLHKKGDLNEVRNWRPIAMMKSVYKIYTNIFANRMSELSYRLKTTTDSAKLLLSHEQAGFEKNEGCSEHIFRLNEAMFDARANQKDISVCWLDLRNAFGSVPHKMILFMMQKLGLPSALQTVVNDMYTDSTTTIKTASCETSEIPIRAGVKQGDPLSPMLFNIALEYLIRSVKAKVLGAGYQLHGHTVNMLAYADDIALVCNSSNNLQQILACASETSDLMGLNFNAKKCATITFKGAHADTNTTYSIQGEPMRTMKLGEHYEYLGAPQGLATCQTPLDMLNKCATDMNKITNSQLSDYQKIDACKTFIKPRLSYAARTAEISVQCLNQLDKTLLETAREACNLQKNSTTHYLFAGIDEGGIGLSSFKEDYHIQLLTHYFRLLTTNTKDVRNLAWQTLKAEVSRWTKGDDSHTALTNFMNPTKGSNDYLLSGGGGKCTNLPKRARKALQAINRIFPCQLDFTKHTVKLNIDIGGNMHQVDARRRSMCYRLLRRAVEASHATKWAALRAQGRSIRDTPKLRQNNAFCSNGSMNAPAFRWIHRARLNLLPTNSNVLTGFNLHKDTRCRRCEYGQETLPHILNHCNQHLQHGITDRHDNLQRKLVDEIVASGRYTRDQIKVNHPLHAAGRSLRPDIVCINEKTRDALIVDVTCPFESNRQALTAARQHKITKYIPEAQALGARGYNVYLNALVVNSLGCFDPNNADLLLYLDMSERRMATFAAKCVESAISDSKAVYWSHILGSKYKFGHHNKMANITLTPGQRDQEQ